MGSDPSTHGHEGLDPFSPGPSSANATGQIWMSITTMHTCDGIPL